MVRSDEKTAAQVEASVEAMEVSDELEDILDRIEQQDEPEVPTLPEYEEAKLSALAVSQIPANDFAAALERAIMRSQQPPQPAALPPPEHPASELKGNFPMRRRNLR